MRIDLNAKLYLLLSWVLMLSLPAYAQKIRLDYENQPLNEVLLDINDRYHVQVSINASLSAICEISLHKEFASVEKALQALASTCGLYLTKVREVYVFREKTAADKEAEKPAPVSYLYQGKVVEGASQEPLPFTYVQLLHTAIVADENGWFSFKSPNPKERLLISHLGHHVLDTVLSAGTQFNIFLQLKEVKLPELVVSSGASAKYLTNIGEEAGHMKLNDVSNRLVPGGGANVIFNNLRLYPGILASGEPSSDYIIWGAHAGQNHVIYDGITLFNSWGISEDIGRVNPLMVKNIEVYKGGYNVPYGDRAGGVVLIDSKQGDRQEANAAVSLTNQIANAYLNVPLLAGRASLQLAGRKSYYQLLGRKMIESRKEEYLVPSYDYADFNLKFSVALTESDQLEISSVISDDTYDKQLESNSRLREYTQSSKIQSTQIGNSLRYAHHWKKGGLSTLLVSKSRYRPKFDTSISFEDTFNPTGKLSESYSWENTIEEVAVRASHTFTASRSHQWQWSTALIYNAVGLHTNNGDDALQDVTRTSTRISAYAHDYWQVNKRLAMELGLKMDLPTTQSTIYWQPRINGIIDLTDRWHASFGWGIYKQFVSKVSILDEYGNLSDVWQIANGGRLDVLSSMHHKIGLSYLSENRLTVSAEGYYKTTTGLGRIYNNRKQNIQRYSKGDARTWGMDIYVKQEFGKHEFWLSYSLGKTEEQYQRRPLLGYQQAPHSQLHELKTACTLDFSPLQVSISHVYGSGFSLRRFDDDLRQTIPYARLDLAVQSSFQIGQLIADAGISILNVLNRKNIRLNESNNFPDGTIFNTLGMPFTPTVYVNLRF